MANWPTVDELKARLDVTSSDWDDQLARLLVVVVGEIKAKVGAWDESLDLPDETLAQAALERAVEYGLTGEMPAMGTGKAERLMLGHRRRWGIA